MRRNRIVFSNKVVNAAVTEDGASPIASIEAVTTAELERLILPPDCGARLERIREQVQLAIRGLDENEREFISRFYYMGETYRHMAEASGRKIYSLEALHRRALRKLRKALARFAEAEFGVTPEKPRRPCVVCDSPRRAEIETLINARPAEATWRSVMRAIAQEYGVRVATPQVLIGHQKYHA
ncbi:MAG: sigma-70 family RNA polymerase sigma factor [candidate division Zixibacteria bacterium]|nr:sigma-70 family RNA polymerase sigma factor [candidate division Zixibacteria bacterium]